MTDDNAAVAATYIWATALAVPVGLVSGVWSGNIQVGLYGFAWTFIPAAITCFVAYIVRENERRRERYEHRLFEALESILDKLDEVRLDVSGDKDASDDWS